MLRDFLSNIVIIQLIGFVAVGLSIAVFQVNNRSTMLKLMIFSACLYAGHFYLLGATTGAAMNVIGAARNFVFMNQVGKKRRKPLPLLFIILFVLATFITWQGVRSLLPLGGMISGTIAFWQINPKYIRRLALISPPLWFTYNFMSGSYPGMLIEMIMLCSNLIGIGRFDIHKRKSKLAQQSK